MSLDRYLDELASQGSAQSRGLFTLDQAEAIRKLREFQIARPWEFVAALVASAVASEAEWVRVDSGRGGFRLEHNGVTISHSHLVTLFSSLLMSGPDREFAAVQELAFGLNALSALRPSKIRMTCSDPQELVLLELTPDKLQVIQADPYETYGVKRSTTVVAKDLRGGLASKLLRTVGQARELGVLKKRCLFAPIPILWRGTKIRCDNPLPPTQCVLKMGAPPPLEALDWPQPWMTTRGKWDAYVGLCPGAATSLTVVAHGVSFAVPEPNLPEGVCVILYGEQFRKDLSHAGIVKDKVFEAAHQELRARCHDFMIRVAQNPSQLPSDLLGPVARSLENEAKLARERWETQTADRLLAAVTTLTDYS